MTTQRDRLQKIEGLGREDLEFYLAATHRAILPQYDKNELIVACEERLERLDRRLALVEPSDISDFGDL